MKKIGAGVAWLSDLKPGDDGSRNQDAINGCYVPPLVCQHRDARGGFFREEWTLAVTQPPHPGRKFIPIVDQIMTATPTFPSGARGFLGTDFGHAPEGSLVTTCSARSRVIRERRTQRPA